jgi:hypothetical protein
MAFGLSEFTDLLDKGRCFAKVAEPEGALDTMGRRRGVPSPRPFGFLMSE